MSDILIIGAGISGLSSAYELAGDGHSVVLLDRYGPAAMASGWTLAGVRQSGRHPAELPLARAAVEIWQTLAEQLDGPTGYRQEGNLRLARNDAEAGVIRQLVADQDAAGLDITLLEGEQAVRDIAPALSGDIVCASLCPSDGQADPDATAQSFLAAGTRRGVEVRFGIRALSLIMSADRVEGVMTDHGPIMADRVVLAAGINGNELLNPVGLDVPLDVQMVTAILSAPAEPMLKQVIGVANADCAGRQQNDGRYRFTGGLMPWHGEILPGVRPKVPSPMSALQSVLTIFSKIVPGVMRLPIEEIWSGLIDLTPDALPVIANPPGVSGLTVAMGFSGHGFCLGPVTGQLVRDLVLGDTPRHDLEAFRIDRFANLGTAPEAATLHG